MLYCHKVEKMSSRVKQLKRQLDEAEEECARLTSLKRKTQRDLDEQIERCDALSRENEQLKSKMRLGGAPADKLRLIWLKSVCVVCFCCKITCFIS